MGLPIGATLVFEVSIFNAAVFLMGLFGAAPLAAHSIAIQIASLTFMVPMGFSQAVTVRVGRAYGARDPVGIARAGWAAFALGVGFMVFTAITMIGAPRLLISAFLDLDAPANAEVVGIAVVFLALAALFQVADGAQVVGRACCAGCMTPVCPWSTPRSAIGASACRSACFSRSGAACRAWGSGSGSLWALLPSPS